MLELTIYTHSHVFLNVSPKRPISQSYRQVANLIEWVKSVTPGIFPKPFCQLCVTTAWACWSLGSVFPARFETKTWLICRHFQHHRDERGLRYTLPWIIQVLVFVCSFVCWDTRTDRQSTWKVWQVQVVYSTWPTGTVYVVKKPYPVGNIGSSK